MDADIQAMDGNQPVVQVPVSGDLLTRGFPSVDTWASFVSPFCHPWTRDFGIHAEVTGYLSIMMVTPAWECSLRSSGFLC